MLYFPSQKRGSKLSHSSEDEDEEDSDGMRGAEKGSAGNENMDPHLHPPQTESIRRSGHHMPSAPPTAVTAPRPAGYLPHSTAIAAGALRGTPWQRPPPSPDARDMSMTPDMLMLSPSMLALQHKYGATSDCSLPIPVTSSEEPSPPEERDDMEMDEAPGK